MKGDWRTEGTEPADPVSDQMDGDEESLVADTSTAKTIWNIANAVLAVSILTLPYAVLRGGWVALGGLVLLAVMSNITGKFLADCLYDKPLPSSLPCFRRAVVRATALRRINASVNDGSLERAPLLSADGASPVRIRSTYPSIGKACWPYGGHILVLLVQCVELLGVSSLSLVLMGSAVLMLMKSVVTLSTNVWISICAGVILPTVLLPRLSQLGWLSLVGIVANFGVFAVILMNSIYKYSDWHSVHFGAPSWQHFPIAIGIIAFSYAAHGQFPSFHIRMEKPMRFGFALDAAFLLCAVLYISVAVLGYLAYGKDTKDIISENMEPPWSIITDVLLLVTLLVSHALPMFPVSALLDEFLRHYFPLCADPAGGSLRPFYFVTTRTFLVGVTLLVAVSVPNFHLLMAFIGSITCMLLVFILPCLFHLILHHKRLSLAGKILDVVLIVVSAAAGGAGVYAAYQELASGK